MILIISVCYFGSKEVPALLTSLQLSSFEDWQLLLVDNSGSIEEAAILEALVETESRATVLSTGENLGYFGAARRVLRSRNLPPYEWLIVANTDLQFAADALDNLSKLDSPGIGILAPSIIDFRTGLNQNPFMTHPPRTRDLLRRRLMMATATTAQVSTLLKVGYESLFRRVPESQIATPKDIYAPHGSALIFSRRYFTQGGNLDHPMFLFGEENHVARECVRLGLRVLFEPSVKLIHTSHAQTGLIRSRRVLKSMVDAARFELLNKR